MLLNLAKVEKALPGVFSIHGEEAAARHAAWLSKATAEGHEAVQRHGFPV